MDRIRYPQVDLTGLNMSGSSEVVVAEPSPARSSSTSSSSGPPSPSVAVHDEATYVALGKEVKEAESTLRWALHNSRGGKFFILHVHQPVQTISIMGANVSISRVEEYRVREQHETDMQKMHKTLDKYILICKRAGVRVEKLCIEMDSIEKGIVELISLHDIKKLVMGAAADKQYSKKMMELKSRKAIFVHKEAPDFCHIWFVCNGHLICTREGTPNGVNAMVMPPVLQASPSIGSGQSNSLRSRSVTECQNAHIQSGVSVPDHRRIRSDDHAIKLPVLPPHDSIGGVTPNSRLRFEGSSDVCDWMPTRSLSVGSNFSSSSSLGTVENLPSILVTRWKGSGNESVSHLLPRSEDHCYTSPTPIVRAETFHDELYGKLQQSADEAENCRREAYEESARRRKAENEALEARCRVKALETMYSEELRRRKEIEEEIEKMKSLLDESKEDLRVALEQKSSFECQIETSNEMIHELEQKFLCAVELSQNYKNEKDALRVERDNALREAEELRKSQGAEASSASVSCSFAKYSFSELEEATLHFDPALKIGEGGYGIIYKGLLRHTQVAIKMLHPHGSQGPLEFQQEVNILGKLRHPNLVILMGVCLESYALIYEYLPNGSLEDRLSCKDNSPPLSWQTRIRIAAELCSVMIFLHSCSPQCIVHGDLKPANILLDANYVSKLSDFGICRAISKDEFSDKNATLFHITDPKGTIAYIDPEFLETGELTPKSDVYSFGVILLRLLTGKSAVGIAKEVQCALDKGNFKDILDPTAGDWPLAGAKQLVYLAMSCCERTRRNRPELSKVWKCLKECGAQFC